MLAELTRLDRLGELHFDRLSRLAASALQAPLAVICLRDRDHGALVGHHARWSSLSQPDAQSLAEALLAITASRGRESVIRLSGGLDHPVLRTLLGAAPTALIAHRLPIGDARCLGHLWVIDRRPRRWGAEQVARLADVAALVETECTRLVMMGRSDQVRAETTAAGQRLSFLVEASRRLASSLNYEENLRQVAEQIVPDLADSCLIAVLESSGMVRPVVQSDVDPERAALSRLLWERKPLTIESPGRLGDVLRGDHSVLWHAPSRPGCASPELETDPTLANLSLIVVGLRSRERIFGLISFATAGSGRRLSGADLALAEELASRAAMAIDVAQLYHDAQEAIRARDEFLSIAAHELRTPVTAVTGFTQLLVRDQARGVTDPERLKRALSMINQATGRLVHLTEELLDVSRLRLGQLPLRREGVDLARFIERVGEQFRFQLGDRHTLELSLAATGAIASADVSRLEQVIINLLANAVKFSPDGGVIRLSLVAEDNGWLVQVTDNGIGLPSGAAESIFEPFARAPNATARHVPGIGLGLYICRSIIERHGGQIWATSEGEGRGTTIAMWLPRDAYGELVISHGAPEALPRPGAGHDRPVAPARSDAGRPGHAEQIP